MYVHPSYQDGFGFAVAEALAVGVPVIVTEDTPASRAEWIVNAAWDWILNLRHGVPTPFTFRSVDEVLP